MAQDWMKVEYATIDKPKVLRIAARLKMPDADLAFAKCFRLWRWFNEHTTTGEAAGLEAPMVDTVVRFPGFAAAAIAEGWLVKSKRGLRVPQWTRHNGQSAKARAEDARRKQESRGRLGGDATASAKRRSYVPYTSRERPPHVRHSSGNEQDKKATTDERERLREEKPASQYRNAQYSQNPPNAGARVEVLAGCPEAATDPLPFPVSARDLLVNAGVHDPWLSRLIVAGVTPDQVRAAVAAVAADPTARRRGVLVAVRACEAVGIEPPRKRAAAGGVHLDRETTAAAARFAALRRNRS